MSYTAEDMFALARAIYRGAHADGLIDAANIAEAWYRETGFPHPDHGVGDLSSVCARYLAQHPARDAARFDNMIWAYEQAAGALRRAVAVRQMEAAE